MRKAVRKGLAFLCIAVLILTNCIAAFAGENTYADKYSFLVSNGVPEVLLNSMSREAIVSMYEDLYGTDFSVESCETSYLRLEENELVPCAVLEPADMELTITLIPVYTNLTTLKKKIETVRVYTTYTWKKIPAMNKGDLITVNWDDSRFSFVPGSFSKESNYKGISGSNVTYETSNAPEKSNQGGLGWSFILYKPVPSLCNGNVSFRLKPSITMYRYTDTDKNNKQTVVNVEYSHDGTPGLLPGISLAGGGVGVSIQPSGSNLHIYNTTSSIALKYSTV